MYFLVERTGARSCPVSCATQAPSWAPDENLRLSFFQRNAPPPPSTFFALPSQYFAVFRLAASSSVRPPPSGAHPKVLLNHHEVLMITMFLHNLIPFKSLLLGFTSVALSSEVNLFRGHVHHHFLRSDRPTDIEIALPVFGRISSAGSYTASRPCFASRSACFSQCPRSHPRSSSDHCFFFLHTCLTCVQVSTQQGGEASMRAVPLQSTGNPAKTTVVS